MGYYLDERLFYCASMLQILQLWKHLLFLNSECRYHKKTGSGGSGMQISDSNFLDKVMIEEYYCMNLLNGFLQNHIKTILGTSSQNKIQETA